MSVIKLTGHTGKPFLISTDKVAAVFADSTGDFTVVSTETEQLYAKESIEEIEALMLRDQFAVSALTGMISANSDKDWEYSVETAYSFADRMLEARKAK